uniref:XDH1 n=1 Tax=Arundo donax TaxID=35708 RepID=A0A0A9DGH8_ARUDO
MLMLAYYLLMIHLPIPLLDLLVYSFQKMCLVLTILDQLSVMRRFLHQILLLVLVRLPRSIRSMLLIFLVFHYQKLFARLSVSVVDLVEKNPGQQYLLRQYLYPRIV